MYLRNKIFIGVAILIAAVLIMIAAAPALVDVNHYRPQIEAKLRERLGRNVSLGPMKLSLFPLAFRVENAVIDEDPGFKTGRPFASVQQMFVRPELLPLLRHEMQISSLQFNRPDVEFVRNAQGVWNFSSLIKKEHPEKPGTFSLDQLKIYDGQVAITDDQQHVARSIYDHIDLIVSDFAPEQPFSADVRAHLPGAGEQVIAWQGKIGPIDRDAPARTSFDGKLKLNGVSLSGLQRFIKAEALAGSEAVLTGSADVKSSSGTFASNGKLDIANSRIHNVEIGYPISIDYQANGNLNDSTANIEKANLRLGQTPVSIQGNINAQPKPPQVDLTVQASNASISETARLASAFGVIFNPGADVRGNLTLNVHAQGPATKPVLSGNVAAQDIRISGGDVREPVVVDRVELSLAPDAIRSNEFTAKTGHTSASVQFNLLQYTTDSPKVEAKLVTANGDLQEMLRIGHAYGIAAVDGMNGSGVITLNVSASGPIKDTDQMTFNGSGEIRNASLEFPAVTKPLALRKADIQFSGNAVNLNNLDASIGQTTAHGNLIATNFSAPRVQFSLSTNHINVAEWEQIFQASRAKPSTTTTPAEKPSPSNEESVLNRTTGGGALTADTIVYDDLTLNNVRTTIALDHGVITMDPLTASLFNGQQTGKVVVNTRTRPVTYTVDSRLEGVDANQLLSSVSPVKQTIYGLLSANADTHFTTAAGARSILPSLNGRVSLSLKDGKIANVDLLHQLAAIAQFNRTAQAVEPFTHLVQVNGDFDIRNGVARTTNLKAAIDEGSLAANGNIDLAQQNLNLHVTAVLSQEFAQVVGGTSIGGFLNTALANNKGELVIPVIVTGRFQEPQFAPDLQKVAQMKLENLVPDVNNPAGLTKGILGQILRQKPEQTEGQQNQPQQPQDPFGNLLDLLQKRTPKR